MLTILSRAIGFVICVALIIVGLVVTLKKFIRSYIIVSEVRDAQKARAKKRAAEQSAT